MIARVWRGVTSRENANKYESMLKPELLPGLSRVPGFITSYLLRRNIGEDVEFMTFIVFDSLESLRRFAGSNYEKSIVPEDRKPLLKHHESVASHFEITSVSNSLNSPGL